MSTQQNRRIRRQRLVAGGALAAGLLYSLCLQLAVRGEVFFSGDGGLKELMVRQFASGDWHADLRLEAEPWVSELWAAGLYPFGPPFVYQVNDRHYVHFPGARRLSPRTTPLVLGVFIGDVIPMRRTLAKVARRALLEIAILGLSAWAALALYLGPLQSTLWAGALAAAGLVAAVAAVLPRLRWWPLALFTVAFICFLVRWNGVQPSNQRDWQPDVAVLPFATFDGDFVTIHNVRNFDYRSETDYTPHYYDKTYDLRQLDSADLIAVYWMGDAIAHIMVSFGFAEHDFVTVSIETRKEVGETYDTVRGFFRQYELIYIVGDERDLIRLRTNYRKDPPEDAYLYRTNAPPENVRRLFLSYFQKINELKEHAGFYNTLTTNCTTNVLMHTKVNPGNHVYSWKILLSGYAPLYTYELGRLDTSLPFEELKRRSHINAAAHAADQAADFSPQIRAGLPKPSASHFHE